MNKEQVIFAEVKRELDRAMRKRGSLHSAHEGYGLILEELDELWDEVKKRRSARSKAAMRREAAQVAAKAIHFIHDLV